MDEKVIYVDGDAFQLIKQISLYLPFIGSYKKEFNESGANTIYIYKPNGDILKITEV